MAEGDLSELSFGELLQLRKVSDDPAYQQWLAPYEHQAYAREYATDNPVSAVGLLAAIPGYQAIKATGMTASRTGTSQPLEQMAAGYRGLGQGWMNALRGRLGAMFSPPAAAPGFGAIPRVNPAPIPNPDPATIYNSVGVRG